MRRSSIFVFAIYIIPLSLLAKLEPQTSSFLGRANPFSYLLYVTEPYKRPLGKDECLP